MTRVSVVWHVPSVTARKNDGHAEALSYLLIFHFRQDIAGITMSCNVTGS